MRKIILILDNIRSVHNVGSIFRTAECAGVNEIALCGVTPGPKDRFNREVKAFTKVSLGAEKNIQITKFETTMKAVSSYKKEGYTVIALEQDKNSASFKEIKKLAGKHDVVIVLGEETEGLDKRILNKCDYVVEIPIFGEKESLNVSVACGIALFELVG